MELMNYNLLLLTNGIATKGRTLGVVSPAFGSRKDKKRRK